MKPYFYFFKREHHTPWIPPTCISIYIYMRADATSERTFVVACFCTLRFVSDKKMLICWFQECVDYVRLGRHRANKSDEYNSVGFLRFKRHNARAPNMRWTARDLTRMRYDILIVYNLTLIKRPISPQYIYIHEILCCCLCELLEVLWP